MSDRSWLRFGAACGILFVVLEFVGFGMFASNSPIGFAVFPPRDEIARAIAQPVNTGTWVGFYLEALASFLLFVFVARLWARLRRAEGDPAWLAATALGAQVAWLAVIAVSLACQAAIYARAGRGADVTAAMALIDLQTTTYMLTWPLMALFLGATAAVTLRTGALSRWLGWSAAGVATLMGVGLLAPTSLVSQLGEFLATFWIVAASIVLLRQADEPRAAAGSMPVASSASVR